MADISNNEGQNLFWSKATLIGASLVAYFFYKFSLLFPKKKNYKFPYEYFVLTLALIFIFLSPTSWNISSVYLENGTFQIVTGFLYIPFLFYFCLTVLIGIFNLIHGYHFLLEIEKTQIKFVVTGIVISVVLSSLVDLILPLLGNVQLVSYGPYFILFFIVFTTYAIIKHHLFDLRIIATELLTFAIWVTLLIKIFYSNGLQETIINIIIFALMIFFGIWLVRSVLKEVRQREHIEELNKEITRAYAVEKKAKEELEKLDKVKDQFLMTAQHNLRTPLTSMMGYSDLLLKGMFGKQTKKTTEVIKKFQLLTQGMIKMVNDFLDMAQFQLGKGVLTLKPGVELGTILDEINGELAFKAESKGISLKIKKPEKISPIKADREKLKAALFNVVDNAVKYTMKGGVEVNVEDGSKVKIMVSDTGIGIPAEKIKTLFDTQFERGSRAIEAASMGSGIGLYLSAQIIKAHQGKIWVESKGDEQGSVFYIELPVS